MPEPIRNATQFNEFFSGLCFYSATGYFLLFPKRTNELPFTMPEKRFKAIHHL